MCPAYLAIAERLERRLVTAGRRFCKALSTTAQAARVLALDGLGPDPAG